MSLACCPRLGWYFYFYFFSIFIFLSPFSWSAHARCISHSRFFTHCLFFVLTHCCPYFSFSTSLLFQIQFLVIFSTSTRNTGSVQVSVYSNFQPLLVYCISLQSFCRSIQKFQLSFFFCPHRSFHTNPYLNWSRTSLHVQ